MGKILSLLCSSLLLLVVTYIVLHQYSDWIIVDNEWKHILRPYKIRTEHLHRMVRYLSRQTQHFQHVEVIKYSIETRRRNGNSGAETKPVIRIAQLSDLHFDSFEDPPTLPQHLESELIERIRDEVPDYVLITGDLVHGEVVQSSRDLVERVLKPIKLTLQELHGDTKQRLFTSFGNHDLHASQRNLLKQVVESDNVTIVLDNDYYFDEENDLVIAGLPDYHKDDFDPVKLSNLLSKNPKINSNTTTHIVMSHVPDSAHCLIQKQGKNPKFNNCQQIQSDIVLSGHTHAGQFKIFGFSIIQFIFQSLPQPIINFLLHSMKFKNPIDNWNWNEGMFESNIDGENIHLLPLETTTSQMTLREGKSYLNVNRGLGGHFGFRFQCQPELTLLELK